MYCRPSPSIQFSSFIPSFLNAHYITWIVSLPLDLFDDSPIFIRCQILPWDLLAGLEVNNVSGHFSLLVDEDVVVFEVVFGEEEEIPVILFGGDRCERERLRETLWQQISRCGAVLLTLPWQLFNKDARRNFENLAASGSSGYGLACAMSKL